MPKALVTVQAVASLGLLVVGLFFVLDANELSGPVVMTLTRSHGIHANDGVTFALWIAAVRLLRPAAASRRPALHRTGR